MIFAAAGFGLMRNAMNFGTNNLDSSADIREEISIKGIVKDVSITPKGYKKLDVKLISAESEKAGSIFENDKNVHIRLITDSDKYIEYNYEIEAHTVIEKLSPPENYGEFNSMVYNGARGFDYTAFAEDLEVSEGGRDFLYYIKSLRNNMLNVYDEILPESESGVLKSVVTGYRSDLSDETKEIYKTAGIFHVLAISGMHVSILAGGIFVFLMKVFRFSRRKSSLISIGIIALYAVFTGGNVPVVRAVLMFSIAVAGNICGRIEDKFNSLSLAAIVILLFNPWFLFDTGFLLSFGATAGVLTGLEILSGIEKDKKRKYNSAYRSIIVSLTVLGFIIPISIWFFGEISFYSVITNIIVAVTFPFVMVLGFVAGVVGMFSLPVGTFFGGSVYYILKFIEFIAKIVGSSKYGLVYSGRFPFWAAVFYYAGLAFLILSFVKRKKYKFNPVLPVVFAALFFVSLNANRLFFKNNEINFLSVGNGDCAVIKTFDNHVFVIDGGGNVSKNLGENTGKNIVLPFLTAKGINHIDGIYISHLDSDHALGAIELMDLTGADAVYIPDIEAGEAYVWNRLYDAAQRNGIPVYTVNSGDKFEISENAFIECLSPDADSGITDTNQGSMVLKYTDGDFSALFTGDIDSLTEEELIKNGKDLSADVLKAAHHGSKYSTSEEFVNAVGNKISVISAGQNNVHGHPAPETLDRLSNTKIFVTFEEGTVKITTNGKKYKAETMKGGVFK
ncbi:MAG: DNA internalization-related competence protein ComEC/Rec2 [Firmicutes bacterium]|nr:DNA internalization-related competence protein ComEC/Rec2 [Bacillota bacterium]